MFTKRMLWFIGFMTLNIGVAWIVPIKPPIIESPVLIDNTNSEVAEPLWGEKALAVVFADKQAIDAHALNRRLAEMGVTAVIVDSQAYLQSFTTESKQCLSHENIDSYLKALLKKSSRSSDQALIVAGIGTGALIPFLDALSVSELHVTNLSIGFTVNLGSDLNLCPPLSSTAKNKSQILTSSAGLEDNWRAVWTDQPDNATSIFIRALGNVDTRIAPYDTPLDQVLIQELNTALGRSGQATAPMPVVEVPAGKTNDTVTLFYSGDGGWRDLDRSVAGEMAKQNFPVVGVDMLRYFWEHKTPEQAAADLSATMAFYRQHWGVKSFVLAGYSFGADVLPPIYNRLPSADQHEVALLVLLALADHADFEIHVAGWLGQKGGEVALAPELAKMPKEKILCIYGSEEKAETACTGLTNSAATLLELPGGHHFDQDYPKLTGKILDIYRRHSIR